LPALLRPESASAGAACNVAHALARLSAGGVPLRDILSTLGDGDGAASRRRLPVRCALRRSVRRTRPHAAQPSPYKPALCGLCGARARGAGGPRRPPARGFGAAPTWPSRRGDVLPHSTARESSRQQVARVSGSGRSSAPVLEAAHRLLAGDLSDLSPCRRAPRAQGRGLQAARLQGGLGPRAAPLPAVCDAVDLRRQGAGAAQAALPPAGADLAEQRAFAVALQADLDAWGAPPGRVLRAPGGPHLTLRGGGGAAPAAGAGEGPPPRAGDRGPSVHARRRLGAQRDFQITPGEGAAGARQPGAAGGGGGERPADAGGVRLRLLLLLCRAASCPRRPPRTGACRTSSASRRTSSACGRPRPSPLPIQAPQHVAARRGARKTP